MDKLDVNRLTRPPTLAKDNMAKKSMKVNLDPASKDGDTSVAFLIDQDTLLDMYWNSIPDNEKRKIKVGECHEQTFSHKST